jgi:DNA-binding CsgD family transcriptional regulator
MLIERGEEVAQLRALVDATLSGTGAIAVIEGAAGIGKTSVLEVTRELATEAGCDVRFAHAGWLERDLGWNVVRQLFSDVVRASAAQRKRLLAGANALAAPALGLAEGSESGAFHGLYWLTAELASRAPVVLAVDDAQWSDAASLRYLAYLASRLEDLPVLLVATVRRGEETDEEALAALSGVAGARVIALRELSPDGSAQLTRSALGAGAATDFCTACHRATRGNPFLLGELLGQLDRDGIGVTAAGAAEITVVRPESVTRSVLLRLARLPHDARTLAGAVAVLGDDAALANAARLAGIDEPRAIAAAEALVAAEILQPSPLRFVHPIVHETIAAELSPMRRAHAHREAALMLAGVSDADPERVAVHLLRTNPSGDAWVVEQLRAAARSALASGDSATGRSYLERALAEPPAAELRAEVLFELGTAEARTDLGGVSRLRESLSLTVDPHKRAEIALALGSTVGLAGDHVLAADVLEAGLEEVHDDEELRLRLLAEQAGHCLHAAARLQLGFERLATVPFDRPASDPAEHQLRVIAGHGAICSGFMTAAQAREIALVAAAGRRVVEREGLSQILFVAELLVYADELESAVSVLDDAIADARSRGSLPAVALASAFRAQAMLRRGAVLEAEADARTSLEVLDTELLGYCRPYVLSFAIDVLVELGRLDEAELLLALAGPRERWPQLWQYVLLAASEGRLLMAHGSFERAAEVLVGCGASLAPWRPRNPASVPWRSAAAVALAAAGDRDEAVRLARWELSHARELDVTPRPLGIALRACGLAEGGEQGVALLREAVAVLERSSSRLEHARALVDLGAALRRSGSRVDARESLRAGLEAARRCGAAPLAQQAWDELVAAGGRPRGDAQDEGELLTPSELRVARLAADGRTNREIAQALFVSLRTVETHLTHVYQKLDIDSRSALAGALAERAPASAVA